ncbi:MAG: glycoside hydrolase family 3 C-terminal domain-containing protein [Saprospirales bacterium]|nr:glycoside hydrolase family 3 C-terminal domain-containing protein [Saprospirales bacterium]MBK8489375.1 glycoside hydrolase family 3 C-terminal domain-containing protein [Saprospirales bacterium]
MNLEEKIGQMNLFTSDWDVTGPTLRENYKEDIVAGKVGAIFNAHTAAYNRELQRIAVEESRLKIPLLFGYDVIHGYKTIFPIPLGEAASWDLEAIERSASVAAAEASAAGLHWTFAPMVDISREPRWGRVMEGAGEDPYLGSMVARARVRGFQGETFENADKVLACVKHFAAYGAPEAGREYNTVDMSDRMFRDVYLPPYKAAVEEGAYTVMTSFNELDGVPASGNSYLLHDILREEWGFKGIVVTDYTSINEMVLHGIVADEKEAGELALQAGVDMDMQGAVYYKYLKQSVEEGKISVTQIDQAVRNILRVKFILGLFDDPYRYFDTEREKQVLFSQANQEAALDMARKSIVLLRNENQTLPLSKELRSLAVIGPLADSQNDLIGAWSGAGNGNDCVSLLKGLQDKAGTAMQIRHARGCDFEGTDRSGFAAALSLARQSDAIVVAIGEKGRMSGEAMSRSDITLPGVQEELVKALVATGKPVVVVLMNGRPLAIPWIAENTPAVLETWFLGTKAGNAIADVLFGDYNPSGKLTMTFPRNVGQIPIYYNHKNTGRPFEPNTTWTSHYMDVPNSPQFPFGWGLSYTTFDYSAIQADQPAFGKSGSVTLRVTVSNTGLRDGEEVVQLYVRDLVGSVTRPVRELKGFKKINLKAGSQEEVTFTLTAADLAFHTRSMAFEAETGYFDVFIGGNSEADQSIRIQLTE